MRTVTVKQMQKIDRDAVEKYGIPSIVLMENASRGAAAFFSDIFPISRYLKVLVLVGKGNNGGDGLAIGRILAMQLRRTRFRRVSFVKSVWKHRLIVLWEMFLLLACSKNTT